jgi:L-ascorbate metabolism protein UlaG (beta-lactamase superfamily)
MADIARGFRLTWLGHNSFKLETEGGKTVLLDPWVESNPACPEELRSFETIDVVTISHGHSDHMADAVNLGKRFRPTIVCNWEIHHFLQKKGLTTTSPMNKGGSQTAHGIRFSMVHAVHSSGIEDGGQVVYGGEACGFVITLEDGFTLYHAGDTAAFSDMALIAEIHRPRLALLPIGDLYTMAPREAAIAARMLGARWIVPSHFGTFAALTGTPAELRKELDVLGVKADVIELPLGGVLESARLRS